MSTWALVAPARINREGNQIELDLAVSGMPGGFTPDLRRSIVNTVLVSGGVTTNLFGSLNGWRSDFVSSVQYFELESVNPPERTLFSGVVYAINTTGTDTDVSIALRLRPNAMVSPGADLRPATRALYIDKLLANLVVLKRVGSSTEVASTLFDYDTTSNAPSALNLTDVATTVGKLPGWVSGTGIPVLRLHCDSYAERAARAADGPTYNAAIDAWTDLRSSGANALVQATGSLQPTLAATATTAPTVQFASDLFEQTPGYNLDQIDCAFGVTFRADAGTTTSTQHLIGRWSGQSGTDNNSTWQWRLVYERTAGSPATHKIKAQFVYDGGGFFSSATLEGLIDEPTEKTIAIYRVTTDAPTTGELWANGVRIASTTIFLAGTNASARNTLTVGGRYDGSATLTDGLVGSVDQCFVYSTGISDACLSLVTHEMARRAGIKVGPVPQPTLTQPYGPSNPEPRRRLDRWPIAMINLYGGANYDDNPLSQNPEWRKASTAQILDWLRPQIRKILGACQDFEIMFNRPAGQYRNDIIPAGIFGDIDGAPGTKIVLDEQWDALTAIYDEFGLSDHNNRDGKAAPGSPEFSRRCWFYTGNPTISDEGAAVQNGRVGARIVAPCSAAFYSGQYLEPWAEKDDRFRCFFVDSGVKWDRKWVEISQDPDINEAFTIVGESITTDANARKGAVWFSLVGIGVAPWWINGQKSPNGINTSWSAGSWDQTPIYVGITLSSNGATLDLSNPTGDTSEQGNLRFEDIYRFVDKGVAPVAWGGQYQKIGAAWMYGARRIPVGRYPMMSPRISRICR